MVKCATSPRITKIKDSPVLAPSVLKAEPTLDSEPDAEPDVAEGPSEHEKRHQAEVRAVTAELSGAKEQVEQLKAARAKDSEELAAERRFRKAAEVDAAKLRTKCRLHEQHSTKLKNERANLAKANDALERKLKEMRRGMSTSRSHRGQCSLDELAAQLAAAECVPLGRCSADDRANLKKKLLLKWHPDKQPSSEHSSFATRVVQEMQNCLAWQN
jgi:chromosome segregation ATPase